MQFCECAKLIYIARLADSLVSEFVFIFILVLCLFALWGVYFLSPVSVFLYCDDLSSDILCRQLRFLCLALLGRSKRRPGGQTRSMLMRRIMMMVIRMWLIEESDCSRLILILHILFTSNAFSRCLINELQTHEILVFLFFGIWQWHMHWQCCILVFNTCTRIAGVCWCAARFVCLLAGWKLRRWIAFQTKSASRRPAPGFGGPAEYSAEY